MVSESTPGKDNFDHYAAEYDSALAEGLSVSGEDKTYFARGRLLWLARSLQQLAARPRCVMDFGCGTGTATPYLFEILRVEQVIGIDVSAKSLAVARQAHGSSRSQFHLMSEYPPSGQVDLAFCNGVFHHVPPQERAHAVRYVYDSLRPGGLFALWENNPWNPGARYVMSRIPFDREAIMLSPPESRRMLGSAGLEVLHTDFLFIFPRCLRCFRALEPALARLPLGAQYQVLCRKPGSGNGFSSV